MTTAACPLDPVIATLVAALQTPEPGHLAAHEQAAQALSAIPGPTATAALSAIAVNSQRSPGVRVIAWTGLLVRAAGPTGQAEVAARVQQVEGSWVRESLVHAVARRLRQDALPLLHQWLGDEQDSYVLSTVVHWLGQLGAAAEGDALITALQDPRPPVQKAAAEALVVWANRLSRREPVAQSLILMVQTTHTGRPWAVHALNLLDWREATVVLTQALTHDAYWLVRFKAVETLAAWGADVRPALQDLHSHVRALALKHIAQQHRDEDDTAPYLISAVADPDGLVRETVAANLPAVLGAQARPYLESLLTDPSRRVRLAAAAALAALRAGAARDTGPAPGHPSGAREVAALTP